MTAAPSTLQQHHLLDLLAFAGTGAAAFIFDWRPTDPVWGLWLSSFTVGYSLIVYGIFSSTLGPATTPSGGPPAAAP